MLIHTMILRGPLLWLLAASSFWSDRSGWTRNFYLTSRRGSLVFVQSYRQLEWVNEPRRRQPPQRCPPLLPDSAATPGTDSLGTSENRRFGALRTGNLCVSWRQPHDRASGA